MIDKLGKAVGVGACVVLFLMMMLTAVDVAGRDLFGLPIPGGSELTELAMVITIFLLYPRLAYRNLHISIDLLDGIMNDVMRRLQYVVANLLGAFLFGAITWRISVMAARAAQDHDITPNLQVPLTYVFWFMVLMSAFTAIAFLMKIPLAFRRGRFSIDPASQGHN